MSKNNRVKGIMVFRKSCAILLFAGLLAFMPACKSTKTAVGTVGTVTNKANEQLISDILKAETSYKTISGKISLELSGAGNLSGMKVNSQLKLIRGQIIQLSLRAPFINTEVVRMDITPDSVFIIDRMSKRYAGEDIKKLEKEKNIQFNYSNMQALFTDALFFPGKEQVAVIDYDKYDIALDGGIYKLNVTDASGMAYNFVVDGNDRITATSISGENKNYALHWTYADFVKDEGLVVYPTKMSALVNIGKKSLKLNMSYSGLDIDKEIKVERKMPSNYDRVSITSILKSYIK
jgi:hypothetical protein